MLLGFSVDEFLSDGLFVSEWISSVVVHLLVHVVLVRAKQVARDHFYFVGMLQ